MLKKTALVVVITIVFMAGSSFGFINTSWTNSAGDRSWSNPANWTNGVPQPTVGTPQNLGWWANLGEHGSVGPLIGAADDVGAEVVYFNNTVTMDVTGGHLRAQTLLVADAETVTGTLNISDGDVNTIVTQIGNGVGTIHMTGGQLYCASWINLYGANTHLQMDGGVVISANANPLTNLGTVDITNGRIIIGGNILTQITDLVSSAQLTGFATYNNTFADFNGRNSNRTTITAPHVPVLLNCSEAVGLGYSFLGDINHDCRVNLGDLSVMALDWLKCVDPADSKCSKPWQQ